jgi:hypothetical protein
MPNRRRGKALVASGTILADPVNGGVDHSHTEQISHQRGMICRTHSRWSSSSIAPMAAAVRRAAVRRGLDFPLG